MFKKKEASSDPILAADEHTAVFAQPDSASSPRERIVKTGFFSRNKTKEKKNNEGKEVVAADEKVQEVIIPRKISATQDPVPLQLQPVVEDELKSADFKPTKKDEPQTKTSFFSVRKRDTSTQGLIPAVTHLPAQSPVVPTAATADNVKLLQKSASAKKKKNKVGNVELVHGASPAGSGIARGSRGISSDGVVLMTPGFVVFVFVWLWFFYSFFFLVICLEVLRCKVLEVDARKFPAEYQLFVSFSWIGTSFAKGKERLHEQKTPTKPRPWTFFECESLVFDLLAPDLPSKPLFLMQLWAFGRVKNSLEASLEVPLHVLKVKQQNK
jgi:hypothetical protein